MLLPNRIGPDTPRNEVLSMILKNKLELRKRRLKQNESFVNDRHEEEILEVVEQSCFNEWINNHVASNANSA